MQQATKAGGQQTATRATAKAAQPAITEGERINIVYPKLGYEEVLNRQFIN
jgi:hypothetical protein